MNNGQKVSRELFFVWSPILITSNKCWLFSILWQVQSFHHPENSGQGHSGTQSVFGHLLREHCVSQKQWLLTFTSSVLGDHHPSVVMWLRNCPRSTSIWTLWSLCGGCVREGYGAFQRCSLGGGGTSLGMGLVILSPRHTSSSHSPLGVSFLLWVPTAVMDFPPVTVSLNKLFLLVIALAMVLSHSSIIIVANAPSSLLQQKEVFMQSPRHDTEYSDTTVTACDFTKLSFIGLSKTFWNDTCILLAVIARQWKAKMVAFLTGCPFWFTCLVSAVGSTNTAPATGKKDRLGILF